MTDYIESEWATLEREKQRLRKVAKDILRQFPDGPIPDCDDPDRLPEQEQPT